MSKRPHTEDFKQILNTINKYKIFHAKYRIFCPSEKENFNGKGTAFHIPALPGVYTVLGGDPVF